MQDLLSGSFYIDESHLQKYTKIDGLVRKNVYQFIKKHTTKQDAKTSED